VEDVSAKKVRRIYREREKGGIERKEEELGGEKWKNGGKGTK
jgi:hypothetical protein